VIEVEDLEQIEAKIEQLIEKHVRVKKEKLLAEKQLQLKENESHQLKGQIRQYQRERSEIREKLEKILGQIERLGLP
jgi:septal ring factor EnvC (AmiA/AmiB activator)